MVASMKTPWQQYQTDLERHDFQHDEAQEQAVRALQRLFDQLVAAEAKQSWWRVIAEKLGKAPAPVPQGIYFWGGVGRGKTYLVDTFYETLPFDDKLRIHFHRFMQRVHNELKNLKGRSDPLPLIADKLADEVRVICFDEFFVQDITDAMILGTLMQELFKRNIVLVATSNIEPDNLYRNGLQRERFIPAITQIKRHCEVINVDSGIDYRLRTLTQAEIYHSPLDAKADDNLLTYFAQLAPDHKCHQSEGTITVAGRQIPVRCESDDVALFSFKALCEGPRSQADYIELAHVYHAVLISEVPELGGHNDDAARRFIALVDEFYERKVKLIMSAAKPLEQLYSGGRLDFEFRRCVSRLKEMQSHEYLALGHLA